MVKKVLLVTVGFGMIAAGVAGITTSFLDQKDRAALRQLERTQEEARTAATEMQRKLEEKNREVERIRASLEEERRLFAEERRRTAEYARVRDAAIAEKKRTAIEAKTAPPNGYPRGREDESKKKHMALSKEGHKRHQEGSSIEGSRGHTVKNVSQPDMRDDDFKRISWAAGLEAARFFEPIEYHNQRNRERVLAEPFDYSEGWVRVRVRIWRNERLVKDTLVNFSEASLRETRTPRI